MSEYTIKESGEANFYWIMKNNNWFANIQMNGELNIHQQRQAVQDMIDALNNTQEGEN